MVAAVLTPQIRAFATEKSCFIRLLRQIDLKFLLKRDGKIINIVKVLSAICRGLFHQTCVDHVVNDLAKIPGGMNPPAVEYDFRK